MSDSSRPAEYLDHLRSDLSAAAVFGSDYLGEIQVPPWVSRVGELGLSNVRVYDEDATQVLDWLRDDFFVVLRWSLH